MSFLFFFKENQLHVARPIKINEKNSALFWSFSGAKAYLESERYAMHICLVATLISLLAALYKLFVLTL
jgi:hypothetical protein